MTDRALQSCKVHQADPTPHTAIYLSHLLGIVGFALGLGAMTRPELFGGSVFWS